jgi:hypothetical protein
MMLCGEVEMSNGCTTNDYSTRTVADGDVKDQEIMAFVLAQRRQVEKSADDQRAQRESNEE